MLEFEPTDLVGYPSSCFDTRLAPPPAWHDSRTLYDDTDLELSYITGFLLPAHFPSQKLTGIDFGRQAEDFRGAGLGPEAAEAHLLRYATCFQPPAQAVRLHSATGKILKDEDTVESYKIEEKGFVVCVVNKVCLERQGRQ